MTVSTLGLFKAKSQKHSPSGKASNLPQFSATVVLVWRCDGLMSSLEFYLLVVLTILKNMKVNGKDYPIYEMENKKCLKPPTSFVPL
jgi:hypothetical protein